MRGLFSQHDLGTATEEERARALADAEDAYVQLDAAENGGDTAREKLEQAVVDRKDHTGHKVFPQSQVNLPVDTTR